MREKVSKKIILDSPLYSQLDYILYSPKSESLVLQAFKQSCKKNLIWVNLQTCEIKPYLCGHCEKCWRTWKGEWFSSCVRNAVLNENLRVFLTLTCYENIGFPLLTKGIANYIRLLRWKYKHISYLWVKEKQSKPHLHVLLNKEVWIDWNYLVSKWEKWKIGKVIDVRYLKNLKMIASYISKYFSKFENLSELGRKYSYSRNLKKYFHHEVHKEPGWILYVAEETRELT